MDALNTHESERLVRLATALELELPELGIKGKVGILHSMATGIVVSANPY
jgi:hypothetical protein